MKATYKRYLAAAFATVGLMNLGFSQTTPDAMGPTQQSVGTADQSQTTAQPSGVAQDQTSTTDLGVAADIADMTLDTSNAPKIMVNQTEVSFLGAQPGLINGQLMVPVRDVAEQLGASVEWRDQDKQVVIQLPDQQSVTLATNQDWLAMISGEDQGGSPLYSNGGPERHLILGGNEVILIGNRAYVPFDQLASDVSGSGSWDQSAGTATITTNQTPDGEDGQVQNGPDNPPAGNPPPNGTDPSSGSEASPNNGS